MQHSAITEVNNFKLLHKRKHKYLPKHRHKKRRTCKTITQMVCERCQPCAGESIKHVRVWRGGGGGGKGEKMRAEDTREAGGRGEREREREGGVKERRRKKSDSEKTPPSLPNSPNPLSFSTTPPPPLPLPQSNLVSSHPQPLPP